MILDRVDAGRNLPEEFNVIIEIPAHADPVKYEVDKETGNIELIDYVAVVDCGTPINPNLARVQTEGGVAQGIGMALMLGVLASDKLQHPALECLFTTDEETGLTGAFALEPGFFEGKTLINLDSEDEGELFIGCAGGGSNLGGLISPFMGEKLRGEKDYKFIAIISL